MPQSPLYETDFYAWAKEQAALLRAGKLSAADIENIAEEIDSMGRSEKRELVSRLTVLLLRLLKWRFQPERRSWEASISVRRNRLARHLVDNPSLKPQICESLRRRLWRRHSRCCRRNQSAALGLSLRMPLVIRRGDERRLLAGRSRSSLSSARSPIAADARV